MSGTGPTALIAEDETVLRLRLRSHLAALWPELRIVAEAADGIEALQLYEEHRPEILFLDIEMPGQSGLALARAIGTRAQIVFVTAYDAYAVAAFERGAIDYVLKPYNAERLADSVRRIQQRRLCSAQALEQLLRDFASAAPPREHLRWINAAQGQEVRLITVEEICYFQADLKYTRVVTVEGEALIRRTLKELLDELDPAQFWQIHRSTIVNASAIAGIRRDMGGRVRLRLKRREELLPVSEAHEHLFRQM